jgi:hypothetical protein
MASCLLLDINHRAKGEKKLFDNKPKPSEREKAIFNVFAISRRELRFSCVFPPCHIIKAARDSYKFIPHQSIILSKKHILKAYME